MQIPTQHKTARVILALLVVLVVGFSLWVWRTQKKIVSNTPSAPYIQPKPVYKPQLDVERQDLDTSQMPQGLPNDLPVESGAETISNYTAKSSVGLSQATREYRSTKSFEELEKTYRDYFTSKNWKVDPTYKGKGNWGISAHLAKDLINVSLSSNGDTGTILVNITYTPGQGN